MAPEYQALSYEWGFKSPTQLIRIAGRQTQIRWNLWNFLTRLKAHGYYDYLWCDAICIDQNNDLERNHQVQLMSQIYRKAKLVLVWLGEDYQKCGHLFYTLRSISACKTGASRAPYLTERASIWKALADVSDRRYWTRIWIIQELTVARDIELFCGGEKVPWSAFATACKFPPDQSGYTPWADDLWAPITGDSKQAQQMRQAAGRRLHYSTMYRLIRSQRRWPQHVERFETLCEQYKESRCEDVRDRVFALLGIAKEVALQRGFSVDYQKNIEETFIALVSWGGTGAIEINSLIEFALLAAKVMNLHWPNYPLEPMIQFERERSPSFPKWWGQPLPISLRCRYFGEWTFDKVSDEIGQAEISPTVFKTHLEPIDVLLPLNSMKESSQPRLSLFGFGSSRVLLACIHTTTRHHESWTVVSRAFYQFRGQVESTHTSSFGRKFVCSVFNGLCISVENTNRYLIKLENFAQFMEIFLNNLDPSVWRRPNAARTLALIRIPIRITTDSAEPQVVDFRSPEQMLQELKIEKKLTLLDNQEEEQSEESDGGETIRKDYEKLWADSEPLVKPRIPKPPIERPKRREEIAQWSQANMFLDPFCERVLEAEDHGSLSASRTSGASLRSSMNPALDALPQESATPRFFNPFPF